MQLSMMKQKIVLGGLSFLLVTSNMGAAQPQW